MRAPGKAERETRALEGSHVSTGMQLGEAVRPRADRERNTTAGCHPVREELFILCEVPSAHHDTQRVYPKLDGCLKSNF